MAIAKKLKPFKVGNSRIIKVTVKDKDTKSAIDISGDKFYFTVKDSAALEDTDAVVQANIVAPADANSVAGIVFIPITTDDTKNVAPGDYEYDIVWLKLTTDPGPPVGRDTIEQGTVNFAMSVTRAQT